MSEASRGTQAPSRPDEPVDFSEAEQSDPSTPSAAAGGAGEDDFYATVNNAAANRSTRINHPNGDAPHDGAVGQENGSGNHSGEGETNPGHRADADADTDADQSGDETKAAGKTWRDRWTGLTASVSGKRARTAQDTDGRPAHAEGAHAAATSEPEMVPVPAPAVMTPPTAAGSVVAPVAAPAAGTVVAVRQSEQSRPAPRAKIGAAHRTRKARLRLSRIDPWSVMKTSFLFSIAAGIVLVVAVYVIWTVIGSSGLFSSVNDIVSSVVSTPGDTTPFRIEEYVNTQKVMGVTALVAVIDVLIFTALATLLSFLYNLAATMLGGLEVTLAED